MAEATLPLTCETLPLAAAPLTAPGRFRSRMVEDSAGLENMEPAWRAMAQAYGPSEQFNWTASCLATLDAGRPLRLVSVNQDEQCVALAPLVVRRVRGTGRLALAGVNDLHEPADLLAADQEGLDRLTCAIVDCREPLVIERMLADSPTVTSFERACRGRAILVRRAAANCPYISLDETWHEPESHLNSGRRSDLRRARRKAEQAGAVRFEILTPAPAEVADLLDQAMAVEAKSWKGTSGTALVHDRRRAEFFQHYVEKAAREGILRICFMHIGDSVVAMQIAIQQNGGFWLLKIGYDASFASASPGLLLMRETIRHAAAAGLATYEFLGRAEAWTAVWTSQERATVTIRIFPFTAKGFTALATDLLAVAGRKLIGRVGKVTRRLQAIMKKTASAPRGCVSRGPVPLFAASTDSDSQGKS